jgi:ketosteroid isomerase-like protein
MLRHFPRTSSSSCGGAKTPRAFVNGDYGPSRAIMTRTDPGTFFDPWGGAHVGAENVLAIYERNSSLFASSVCTFETLHVGASETVGYWVCLQRGTTTLRGATEPIELALRVTEIFRREGEEWKLVHRHADPLK